MTNPDYILKEVHNLMQVLPRTRKKALYERTRQKIAEDVTSIMKEQGMGIEKLAKKLEIKVSEAREWVWTRDLTLSELVKMLDVINSEMYPIIRSRVLWRHLS